MNLNTFDFEIAFGTSAQLPPSDLPEIAFAGRSNVGKSSLLNKVLNRKALARVSSVPGKTVTVNFYKGDGVRLVDLPGYGFAKVSFDEKHRWADLMEGYFQSGRNVKLVVQLVDMRHAPSKEDYDMLSFLQQKGYPCAVVLTKSDKLNKTQYAKRFEEAQKELAPYGVQKILPFSALNGNGAADIRAAIEEALNIEE